MHSDIDSMREEFLHLREQILRELEDMNDPDKAQFLRSELGIINQRLGSLESSASAYLQRSDILNWGHTTRLFLQVLPRIPSWTHSCHGN